MRKTLATIALAGSLTALSLLNQGCRTMLSSGYRTLPEKPDIVITSYKQGAYESLGKPCKGASSLQHDPNCNMATQLGSPLLLAADIINFPLKVLTYTHEWFKGNLLDTMQP